MFVEFFVKFFVSLALFKYSKEDHPNLIANKYSTKLQPSKNTNLEKKNGST